MCGGGREDNFISYRTNNYKLHYYETPTNLKFAMMTDIKTNNLRVVLHQIYVNLYVEYGELPPFPGLWSWTLTVGVVVKNPLSRKCYLETLG